MAFKLPNYPTPRASASELADFAELLTLLAGRCSATEVQRYLSRIDDNDNNSGIDDNDVVNEMLSDAMMTEIGYRTEACPDGYPFKIDLAGSFIVCRDDGQPYKMQIYKYLLLATRLNMRRQHIHAGIDGTKIMEELGALILRSYLGARAKVEVFGTARLGSFEEKINSLCAALGEGGSFRNIDSGATHANDDGLDVVGWIPFSDRQPAKLCVFGQCKTGTSWSGEIYRLDPVNFVRRWMSGTIIVDPVKAHFIAESAERSQWSGICLYGGIFFDRCRIVDISDSIDRSFIQQIDAWISGAILALEESNWR